MGARIHRRGWDRVGLVLVLFGSLLFVTACLSQKKREDITYRFLREHPKVLSDLAAIHFPVTPKPGVPIIVRDTVVYHQVDTLPIIKDSVRVVRVETIKEIINNIYTTDTIPDAALIDALMKAKFDMERSLIRAEADLDHQKDRSDVLWRWVVGLGGLTIVGVVIGGFSLYRRLLK